MKKGETVWCGRCFKRFSYVDWAKPAEALQEHYLDGSCPKAEKALAVRFKRPQIPNAARINSASPCVRVMRSLDAVLSVG